MTNSQQLEKKIKRHIYGKPQSILVVFPAGLADAAFNEAKFILDNLWFQNKFPTEVTVQKNALRIDHIHMFAVLELMMRGLCFTDIRLIVNEGKVANMPAFVNKCADMDWDFYLAKKMTLKVKVDVGASASLHEGAMKEKLEKDLQSKIHYIVNGDAKEPTTTLYVDVYKHQLLMSLSLAGLPLYKRGYRSVLSKSAPLREDMAACCIQKSLQLPNDSLFVPFSGTGTFLFEYWMTRYQFAPALFGRDYAIQAMPLYRAEHFNFLLKKAREHCLIADLAPDNFYCIDNAADANEALQNNISHFKQAVEVNGFAWNEREQWVIDEDFLKADIANIANQLPGNIFIPMNPPYGLRMGINSDTVKLYKQIARQINSLAVLVTQRNNHISGFILCPSEDSWSAFCKTLTNANIETFHMTQGGLDIRVAQFHISASSY